jgi:hypothetical protein
MVIEPNTIIPIDAKVVDVPGYGVDKYGRILGKGHAVRDTVTWMIPLLWPIDLINLPRRGPYPTLKEETRLTLKVMDDLGVPMPDQQPLDQTPSGLYKRPSAYEEPAPAPAPPPQQITYIQPAPPPPTYVYVQPPVVAMMPPPRTVIVYRNGYAYRVAVPY